MVDGLSERFASIRKEQGLNVKEFAESLDMEATTVSSIESGKREPSKEVLFNLAIKYAYSLNWIFTGLGEPRLSKAVLPPDTSLKIPLLRQKVSCGPGENWESEENIAEYIAIDTLIPRLGISRIFALKAQGSSMLGTGIRGGDYVLFNAGEDQDFHDGIYVFALDGDLYCKRLEFDKIAQTVKIFSVRSPELEKAELVKTLNIGDTDFADRFRIFGRVSCWIHPNMKEA
jgi:transcriptional regulator with XRE-family HTH domain